MLIEFRCTALFQFAFPSEADTSPNPTIQAFDLGKPVVDFVVGIDSLVWVLVDSEWSSTAKEGETKVEPPSSQIRRLGWSGDNQVRTSPPSRRDSLPYAFHSSASHSVPLRYSPT